MESTRKHHTFLALLAAAALIFVAASATPTHAQSRGYWATDGCYYQRNGYGYQAIECRSYDGSGTLVARNRNGAFYWHNGRWLDQGNYLLALMQELAIRSNAENQRIMNRSNVETSNVLTGIRLMGQYQRDLRIASRP